MSRETTRETSQERGLGRSRRGQRIALPILTQMYGRFHDASEKLNGSHPIPPALAPATGSPYGRLRTISAYTFLPPNRLHNPAVPPGLR